MRGERERVERGEREREEVYNEIFSPFNNFVISDKNNAAKWEPWSRSSL